MFGKCEVSFWKTAILISLLIGFSFFSFLEVLGETSSSFRATDLFEIPDKNATVSFAVDGVCERIVFENGNWFFIDLRMGDIQSVVPSNLQVWAQDCGVTILSCQIYNSSFGGFEVKNARVRYLVEGGGVQFFDLGLDPEEGDWSVVVNGEYKGKDEGWELSSVGSLTLRPVGSGNVTLSFYGHPQPYIEGLGPEDFWGKHYVVAVLAVAVIVAVVLSAVLSRKISNTAF